VANIHVIHPLEDVAHLDGVIIGGGDLIIPDFVNNAYFREELFDKPCWVYGAGIPNDQGWSDKSIDAYKRLFDNAEGIYLRDPRSVDIMQRRLGITASEVMYITWGGPLPDSGKYIKNDFTYGNPTTQHLYPWMGLSIRPESFVVTQFMHIVDLVNAAYRSMGLRTLCIPLHPTDMADLGDCRLHELLATLVNTTGGRLARAPNYIQMFPQNAYLDQRMGAISRCNVYVTTRYHGAIAALRYRVPVVVLADPNSVKFNTLEAAVGCPILAANAEDLCSMVISVLHNGQPPGAAVASIEGRAVAELTAFKDKVMARLAGR